MLKECVEKVSFVPQERSQRFHLPVRHGLNECVEVTNFVSQERVGVAEQSGDKWVAEPEVVLSLGAKSQRAKKNNWRVAKRKERWLFGSVGVDGILSVSVLTDKR